MNLILLRVTDPRSGARLCEAQQFRGLQREYFRRNLSLDLRSSFLFCFDQVRLIQVLGDRFASYELGFNSVIWNLNSSSPSNRVEDGLAESVVFPVICIFNRGRIVRPTIKEDANLRLILNAGFLD